MVKRLPLNRLLMCFFVTIFMLISVPVWAGVEGTVTGSVLNIRQNPGTSYNVIAQVKAGDVLTIIDENSTWYKVRLNTGKEGWVHKDYLNKKMTVDKKVVVTGTTVNLRKGPGTDYGKLDQVKAGEILSVYNAKDGWYLVRMNEQGQAWIAGWLVKDKEETAKKYVIVDTKVLNVRKGPGTQYSLLTKIGLYEKHLVVDEKDGWFKIQVGNQQGWVSGQYVKIDVSTTNINSNSSSPSSSDNNSTSNTTTITTTKTVIVVGDTVNVRNAADINAQIVSKVYKGQRLNVTGQKGDWYQVQLSDGNIGWIASWLTEEVTGVTSSRGGLTETEVLVIPIASGKSFSVIDAGGRASLVFKGWTNDKFRINTQNNFLRIEIEENSSKKHESQISRLGITNIKLYPENGKLILDASFTYKPSQSVIYDEVNKSMTFRVGGIGSGTSSSGRSLSGKLIVIDPGHASVQPGGWLDPGAVGFRTGLYERDVNLSIALRVKELLEGEGARVIMTHTGRTELTLAGRAQVANNSGADIFVSIHANSSDKALYSGHSTYFYAPSWDPVLGSQRYERQKLATLVQRELVLAGGRIDLGIKEEAFAVLRETRVPSILVETAFLSDRVEEILLGDEAYRRQLADGIFRGIKAYFQ